MRSRAIGDAFARVPREAFVGPGPWRVSGEGGTRSTPDGDLAHVYQNVRIALDTARDLNNGRPYVHARWLDALSPAPGDHIVHVGAGTGYYSAILAEIVGGSGRVTAIETDLGLGAALRENVAPWPQVKVYVESATRLDLTEMDGLYANVGLSHPEVGWLDGLRRGGRMILPLTDMGSARFGAVLCLRERSGGFDAAFLDDEPTLRVYSYVGGRDAAEEARLASAFARGGHLEVRSLRRDAHAEAPSCWLHGGLFCLSRLSNPP